MYNVLICDDEKDIVSALKIYLSGEDYQTLKRQRLRGLANVKEKGNSCSDGYNEPS
jgi:DNA-binding response OmpR family regulator